MKRLIMLKGLPASGKSTWAKEQIDQYPGRFKRVNKDDLRAMLDNSRWSKANEKFVLKVRDFIVSEALNEGYSVIVDDTNLHPRHEQRLREIAKEKGARFEVKEFLDVPIEECIKRDLTRPNSVGSAVIKQMAHRYGLLPKRPTPEYNPDLPQAVICDIDGTLAILNGRNPYDASDCINDTENKPVASLLRVLKESRPDIPIILVSGREHRYMKQTEEWLKKQNIPYDYLYMRSTGDNRKDAIVKQEIYERHIKPNYNVWFVIDDRKQVVEMWRDKLGLTVFQVDWGEF